jgi:acyl-CoA synthetase (NDP forming)
LISGHIVTKYKITTTTTTVDILVKFSRLVEDNPEIREADLSPVIALEEGKGAYVVDARFILQV